MSVLLLSGGLDSLVLLAQECHEGRKPWCLAFDYGQRHVRELESAARIAEWYGAPFKLVSLPESIFAGSALTGEQDVPRAHYADAAQVATVVPARNLVFLSMAAGWALQVGAAKVLIAAHAGDAAIYPDCRPEFLEATHLAMQFGYRVGVSAPFLRMTKRDIVQLGRSLSTPLEMAWSCYEGGERPCGKCGACVERAEAMA